MTTPSLTPEECQRINRTIAEGCGWTQLKSDSPLYNGTWAPPAHASIPKEHTTMWAFFNRQHNIPNYCSSLDACALAEAVLREEEIQQYMEELSEVTNNPNRWMWPLITATAEQRSHALAAILARRAQQ